MDYTTRHRSNLNPGKFNFDLLESIYGNTIRGAPVTNSVQEPVANGPVAFEDEKKDEEDEDEDEKEKDNKKKPPRLRRLGEVVEGDAVPDLVQKMYSEAAKVMEDRDCVDCLVDLGNGYQVEVHQLSVE